jgi:menaquinone-dependent protoporphyrinogen oxidase
MLRHRSCKWGLSRRRVEFSEARWRERKAGSREQSPMMRAASGITVALSGSMTPRFLIVYGTTDGHTAKVAAAMASTLLARGVSVSLQNSAAPRTSNPADYPAVIVAASVHAGTYQRSVRRWVQAHHVALNERPSALVSVCLAVLNHGPKVERDLAANLQRFFDETGWKPLESKIVAGALLYTKYPWWKRWMMRRIVATCGGDVDTKRDYVYTDWDDLDEFVIRFSAGVSGVRETLSIVQSTV